MHHLEGIILVSDMLGSAGITTRPNALHMRRGTPSRLTSMMATSGLLAALKGQAAIIAECNGHAGLGGVA
jgi:hypothetical protein